MKILNALKAERLISQIQAEGDPSTPGAKKSFEKLRKMGIGAVPKILDALGGADKRQTVEYVDILSSTINDKSLPTIVQGLADEDPKTVAGTAWALSSSRKYNPNRLLDLLADDHYSKSSILDVLAVHKDRLNIRQLLAQVYHLQPSEKGRRFQTGRRSCRRVIGAGSHFPNRRKRPCRKDAPHQRPGPIRS